MEENNTDRENYKSFQSTNSLYDEQIRILERRLEKLRKLRDENQAELPMTSSVEISKTLLSDQAGSPQSAFLVEDDITMKTYKKTKGANDQGREYEYLICALYAFKLSQDTNVHNFEMTTNNRKYGVFDDVSLKLTFKDKSQCLYLLQLKHKESEKMLKESHFSTSDDFGMYKYLTCYENLTNDNPICIIFTNCPCNIRHSTFQAIEKSKNEKNNNVSQRNQNRVEIVATTETVDSTLNLLLVPKNDNTTIIRFDIGDNDKKNKKTNIFLVPNQVSSGGARARITETFKTCYQEMDCRLEDLFIGYMKEWRDGHFVLTKDDTVAKLTELSLSPWIETISEEYYSDDTSKQLKKSVDTFKITIVEDFENNIPNIWYATSKKLSKQQESNVRKVESKYRVSFEQQKHLVMWYLNLAPLVVMMDKQNAGIIRSALKFFQNGNCEKRILLHGEATTDLSNFGCTFTSLSDIENNKAIAYFVQNLKVSLQGRGKILLEELHKFHSNILSLITTKQLFEAVKNDFVLIDDKGATILDDHYICRTLLGESGRTFQESELLSSLRSPLNALSGPAGIGKSMLFKVLSEKYCPSSFWSVYVCLKEHNEFLKSEPRDDELLQHFLTVETPKTNMDRFKHWFVQTRNVYIFLDGLDEIEDQCAQVVLNFARRISTEGFQVWIGCRDTLRNVMIDNLGVIPIEIQGLDEEEQKQYFQKFLHYYNPDEANEIVEIIHKSLFVTGSLDLLQNPSYLDAITKTFADPNNGKDFYNKLRHERLLVLTKVLELMINKTKDRFLEKVNSENSHLLKTVVELYQNRHKLLGLRSCLDDQAFAKLNVNDKELSQLQQTIEKDYCGLVKYFDENKKAVFVHQQVAEYFATLWLNDKLHETSKLKDELFSRQHESLKQMLDILLNEDFLLHLAIIYANIPLFDEHLNKSCDRDKAGRNALHIIVSYAMRYPQSVCEGMIEKLLSCMDTKSLAETDILFNFTCGDYLNRCSCSFRDYISQKFNIS